MKIKGIIIAVLYLISFVAPASAQSESDAERYLSSGDRAKNNGDMRLAEESYRLAIDEYERLGFDSHLQLAMEKLRNLFRAAHRWEEALQSSFDILDLRKRISEDDPEGYYYDYSTIAYIYGRMGKEREAYSYLGLMEKEAVKKGGASLLGNCYLNYGLTAQSLKKWDDAAGAYAKSGEYFSGCDDEECVRLSKYVKPLLAGAYYNAGKLEESHKAYSELCDLYRSTHGVNSTEYAEAVCWLANIEAFRGLLDDAKSHYLESWGVLKRIVPQDLSLLPSNSRGGYWKNINDVAWRMVPFALEGNFNEDELSSAAYEALVYSKGLLLSLEKSTKVLVEESGDASLMDKFMKIADIRNSIAQLQASGNGKKATELYVEMDSLDIDFNRSMQEKGLMSATAVIAPEQIASSLSDREILIDFADFEKQNGDHIYGAFIVRRGMKHPKLMKIFNQSVIDSLLAAKGGDFSGIYGKDCQESLYKAILHPLIDELKGIETVYFVPSGILHQIAVEAIEMPEGGYFNGKYDVVRLSNSKEVVGYERKRRMKDFNDAWLYGGLEYDVEPDVMAEKAAESTVSPLLARRGVEDSVRGAESFRRLRKSGEEVKEISDILLREGINVRMLTGSDGTEESVFSMSGNSPDLLLLSTHGFYFSPEKIPSWSALNGYDNPMYITGLVLSGGNAEYLGKEIPEGVMGGLLTSSDISMLDLRHTQLCVLSACETGLGETTNEGVYGLQRGFKKAGAGTLVLSLWPVSDLATKDFMIMFCDALAGNGWDKRKSFTEAKKRLAGKYDDPYYWAPFIMID